MVAKAVLALAEVVEASAVVGPGQDQALVVVASA